MCSAELAFRFVNYWLTQGNILKISSTVDKDSEFRSMGFLKIIQILKSHLLVKIKGLTLMLRHSSYVNFFFHSLAGKCSGWQEDSLPF